MVAYGLCVPNFGVFADPRLVADVAVEAEASGWDGLFIWDHMSFVWGPAACDPFVALAAAASATSRIALGTAVAVGARRPASVLALMGTTLDALSGGRFVLGAGVGGVDAESAAVGEPGDERARAAALDETLSRVGRWWRGEPVDGVSVSPVPSGIPIWVGGDSAAARRRAALYDGWIPAAADASGEPVNSVSPQRIREGLEEIGRDGPFDAAVIGYSEPGDGTAAAYEAAGATWWLEQLSEMREPPDAMRARITRGPV